MGDQKWYMCIIDNFLLLETKQGYDRNDHVLLKYTT